MDDIQEELQALHQSLVAQMRRGRQECLVAMDNLLWYMLYFDDIFKRHQSDLKCLKALEFFRIVINSDLQNLLVDCLMEFHEISGDQCLERRLTLLLRIFMEHAINFVQDNPMVAKFYFSTKRIKFIVDMNLVEIGEPQKHRLVDIWFQCRDHLVEQNLSSVIGNLLRTSSSLKALLKTSYAPRMTFHYRKYIDLLNNVYHLFYLKCILHVIMSVVPDIWTHILKSAVTWINCWLLFIEADRFDDAIACEETIFSLIAMVHIGCRSASLERHFPANEVGRFLRSACTVIARHPMKLRKPNLAAVLFCIDKIIKCYVKPQLKSRFWTLLSPKEIQLLVDIFKRSEVVDQQRDNILEAALSSCQRLPPLTKSDLCLMPIPEHLQKALESLPRERVCLETDVGAYTSVMSCNFHFDVDIIGQLKTQLTGGRNNFFGSVSHLIADII